MQLGRSDEESTDGKVSFILSTKASVMFLEADIGHVQWKDKPVG